MKTIMTPKGRILAAVAVSALLVAGCSKKDDVSTLPPAAEGTDYGNTTDPNAGAGQIIPGSQMKAAPPFRKRRRINRNTGLIR